MKLAPALALVLMTFCLTGCRVELPEVESAFVAKTWIKADSPNRTELSPSQIAALKAWFQAHEEGWKHEIADIFPDTFLLFRQKDGQDTWAYLQGNRIWVRNYVRQLSAEERTALDSILHPPEAKAFRVSSRAGESRAISVTSTASGG